MRLVGLILGLVALLPAPRAVGQEFSQTGMAVAAMSGFDRVVMDAMARWGIHGGALAVARHGRLVLARGYGWADVESRQAVQPDSLFRIASLSKPITAATVLRLVEDGRLGLDASAFVLLARLMPAGGIPADPRVWEINVRRLLQHTAGWAPFDPMVLPGSRDAAQAVGAPEPASCETIIRYMLTRQLESAPGIVYEYSNFGYCVLGRVIEQAAGEPYEDYVVTHVLAPMGIARMRIGRTLAALRFPGEVTYYEYVDPSAPQSVFPGVEGPVPWPYGGFYLEAMDSSGGWIASAVDLLRFMTALDGSRPPAFFHDPETLRAMTARPEAGISAGRSSYYGLGWLVQPVAGGTTWWHTGALPGTTAYMVRTAQGWDAAALFNTRPEPFDNFLNDLVHALGRAASGVAEWPDHDLFDRYP